jgi:hypothetical protein
MASRSYTPYKIKRGVEKTYVLGETIISNADTVTFGELKSDSNPLGVYIMKKSDGTEMTQTHAAGTNVVTITGAGTNVDCLFLVWGYRAR